MNHTNMYEVLEVQYCHSDDSDEMAKWRDFTSLLDSNIYEQMQTDMTKYLNSFTFKSKASNRLKNCTECDHKKYTQGTGEWCMPCIVCYHGGYLKSENEKQYTKFGSFFYE
jgi:hypothetical protein